MISGRIIDKNKPVKLIVTCHECGCIIDLNNPSRNHLQNCTSENDDFDYDVIINWKNLEHR